jgi:HK97 family phage major capsid protein
MEYAKIQSVLSVNTEVYEDIPDFAAGLIDQLIIGINSKVDNELLDGDGLAPAGVQHIKGILTYATAWADADYDDSVEKANVADLVDVISSKIQNLDGNYQADLVFLNNVDFLKMKKLKDADGQPIVNKDYFGNFTLGGLTIVPTKKITANTMVIMDSQVGEIRTKRALKLQMGQLLPNDTLNDKQSAIISTRVQFLIRNLDTQAVIKVADVRAAVAAINNPAA